MKHLTPLLLVALLFSGCSLKQPTQPADEMALMRDSLPTGPILTTTKNEAETEVVTPREEAKIEKSSSHNSPYDQWLIPAELIEYNFFNVNEHPDCVSMINGIIDEGDLLSNLITDEATREKANLEIYTINYVKQLEKAIATQSQKEYGSNFYAFHVCHLSDSIDLVAGYLSAKEPRTQALALRNNEEVSIYTGIRLLNQTATGAEVDACAHILEKQHIRWTCFTGFAFDEEGVIKGSHMQEWLIPLNGSDTTSRTYIE